jgi:tripartite-type tricarboxylate transporter receptor subunit TctC
VQQQSASTLNNVDREVNAARNSSKLLFRMNIIKAIGIGVAVCASLLAAPTVAQNRSSYPNKPIRMIVPFPPGGGTDIMARLFAQKFGDATGQVVVVDNRAGAGGTIGAETTVRAAPDGYTLCMVSTSYSTNAALFKLPYDAVRDITPIVMIGDAGILLTLHPSVAAKNVKELIALAKAKPGALNFASTGTGGNTHLATELLIMMAGIRMTHVPYKGTGAALNDLLGGQVQLIMGTLGVMLPHVKTGRLRGIAVTNAKRSSALPDIPTIAETLPGFEATLWYGLWGPKGLPADVVALWNREVRKAAQAPEIKERFLVEGIEAKDGPPEVFRDVIQRDVVKWSTVVKAANIRQVQ